MNAVVVGGNGFIGSHLVDRLAHLGWPTTVIDTRERLWGPQEPGVRHLRFALDDTELLEHALRDAEIVFHLAWTSIHESSNRDPAADVLANVVPSLRLLAACTRAGVRRVVFVSSGGTVYGPATSFPIGEDYPTAPLSAYGINKLAVEEHVRLAHRFNGLEYVILRPSVAYGPRQDPSRRQGAVAVFLHRIANGLPVTIYGSDEISRDFFYVADLVDALVASADRPTASPGTYNIGGPAEVTLRELIGAIETTVGRAADVRYEPARGFDAPRIVLDTARARAALDWQPRTDLVTGLGLTWDSLSQRGHAQQL